VSTVAEPRAPDVSADTEWQPVCNLDDIPNGTGAAALVNDEPLAIFRVGGERLFVLGNIDPFSGASVLSRGIVGDIGGEPVVASPIYKQHFRLADGLCIEDATSGVASYPVELVDNVVMVRVPARRCARKGGQ
jgi:NAD(P)H-dependent nitrite reductase small subunit